MDLNERLKKYYNFSDEDLDITFDYFHPEYLKAKTFFLEKGKIADRIGFIRSGMLRSFIYNDNADEITTHFFLAGTVAISMDSFNRQVSSKEFIIAIEDSELMVMTHSDMQQLIKRIPVWKQIIKEVDEHKFKEQMNRSIQFQTLSASERYQLLIERRPQILQKAALTHIASYLGIDIATLSRIRRKL